MSYQKNYPNGWQSGEAGGTPITPETLNNMEDGIANSLPKDGTDPMSANLPMGGNRVTGLGDPVEDEDAVPLGYAGEHFAPAGYGLGENTARYAANLNQATTEGWWYTNANTAGLPSSVLTYLSVFVKKRLNGETIQEITSMDGNKYRATRWSTDGGATWRLEWDTPPMILGVEYRTTKRHNGKVVYAMTWNLGAVPNASTTNFGVPVSGITEVVSIIGTMSNGYTVPFCNGANYRVDITANKNTVIMYSSYDTSGATCIATMEYTKD